MKIEERESEENDRDNLKDKEEVEEEEEVVKEEKDLTEERKKNSKPLKNQLKLQQLDLFVPLSLIYYSTDYLYLNYPRNAETIYSRKYGNIFQ